MLTKGRYADLVKKFPTDAARFCEAATKRMEARAAEKLAQGADRHGVQKWASKERSKIGRIARDIERAKSETQAKEELAFQAATKRFWAGKETAEDITRIKDAVIQKKEAMRAEAWRRYQEAGKEPKVDLLLGRLPFVRLISVGDFSISGRVRVPYTIYPEGPQVPLLEYLRLQFAGLGRGDDLFSYSGGRWTVGHRPHGEEPGSYKSVVLGHAYGLLRRHWGEAKKLLSKADRERYRELDELDDELYLRNRKR